MPILKRVIKLPTILTTTLCEKVAIKDLGYEQYNSLVVVVVCYTMPALGLVAGPRQ